MSQQETDKLFELLRTACQQQFAFEPNRISENMHYMGRMSATKHRFRDSLSHSEIHLMVQPNADAPPHAVLFERGTDADGDWPESFKASYRKTDDEIQAAREALQSKEQYVRHSAIWAEHAPYLRSLFREHPTYAGDAGPTPRDGAEELARRLLTEGGLAFAEFAKRLESDSPAALGHWLLTAYSTESTEQMEHLVRSDARYPQLISAAGVLAEKQAVSKWGEDQAEYEAAGKIAEGIINDLPRHLRSINSTNIFIERLIRMALADNKA
ncbi:hypothetical protein YA0089_26225 [Pseudomonas viridiflava]|uniref:hypothetical protein n=1 Tax=Pseudomonas viridiflava TaxID=33069 RepID=UPI0018E5D424|nr:hypothetical protein [Pseudomonas viridiflava]MBI6727113.1 hypothetical protein [Pseudomonas viridiflava]